MNKTRILQVSIAIIVLVFIIYYAVDYLQKGAGNSPSFSGGFGSKPMKTSTYGNDPTEAAMDGILINLKSGQYKFMKADMTFKMGSKDDKAKIKKNMRKVRDLILRYTSSLDSAKLVGEAAQRAYKKNLQDLIYSNFGYDVKDIYFRNFVLAQ